MTATLGAQLRDEALATVLEHAGPAFTESVGDLVLSKLLGKNVTGEEIRLLCLKRGIRPHHHNAWGGIVNALVRRGVLVRLNGMKSMVDPTSHARKTFCYLVCEPEEPEQPLLGSFK